MSTDLDAVKAKVQSDARRALSEVFDGDDVEAALGLIDGIVAKRAKVLVDNTIGQRNKDYLKYANLLYALLLSNVPGFKPQKGDKVCITRREEFHITRLVMDGSQRLYREDECRYYYGGDTPCEYSEYALSIETEGLSIVLSWNASREAECIDTGGGGEDRWEKYALDDLGNVEMAYASARIELGKTLQALPEARSPETWVPILKRLAKEIYGAYLWDLDESVDMEIEMMGFDEE